MKKILIVIAVVMSACSSSVVPEQYKFMVEGIENVPESSKLCLYKVRYREDPPQWTMDTIGKFKIGDTLSFEK